MKRRDLILGTSAVAVAPVLPTNADAQEAVAGETTKVHGVRNLPERRQVFLEVVDYEEYREVVREGGELKLVPDSEKAFLILRAPCGGELRVQLDHKQLDPILGMVFPDFDGGSL